MGIGPLKPGVFLDRDGVFNDAVIRDGKPFAEGVRIAADASGALLQLKTTGFPLIVVTKRRMFARGKQTAAAVEEISPRDRPRAAGRRFSELLSRRPRRVRVPQAEGRPDSRVQQRHSLVNLVAKHPGDVPNGSLHESLPDLDWFLPDQTFPLDEDAASPLTITSEISSSRIRCSIGRRNGRIRSKLVIAVPAPAGRSTTGFDPGNAASGSRAAPAADSRHRTPAQSPGRSAAP